MTQYNVLNLSSYDKDVNGTNIPALSVAAIDIAIAANRTSLREHENVLRILDRTSRPDPIETVITVGTQDGDDIQVSVQLSVPGMRTVGWYFSTDDDVLDTDGSVDSWIELAGYFISGTNDVSLNISGTDETGLLDVAFTSADPKTLYLVTTVADMPPKVSAAITWA